LEYFGVGLDEMLLTFLCSHPVQFSKSTDFNRIEPSNDEPRFSLRVNAAAEIGMTFNFDLVFYELLQGTLALDLGIGAEMVSPKDLYCTAHSSIVGRWPPFSFPVSQTCTCHWH